MTGNEIALLLMIGSLFAGILSGIPAMLAIAGVPFVAALLGSVFGVFDLTFLSFFPARVWGIMSNTLLMAVPLFVLMGVLLERSGLAQRMLGVLNDLVRGSPRGIALAILAFSTLIAAATGIIGATVVMLVLIGLPAMREAGIPKRLSAGIICASGTLGQIIPPSILLVLLGDQIGNTYLEAQQRAGNFAPDPVSVGDLFAGALMPGLMLVALYAVFIALTLRPGRGVPLLDRRTVPARVLAFTFLPPILLIVAVLGSILAGVATTTEAAGLGAVGALLLAGHGLAGRWGRRLIVGAGIASLALVALRIGDAGRGLATAAGALAMLAALVIAAGVLWAGWRLWRGRILAGAVDETVRISGMVFGIVVAASMLSLVFRGFGGDEWVSLAIADLPGGTGTALAMVMLVVFLLGFMLEAVEIIYIVVPLLGPPILGGDISPVFFGVLLAMNLQTSFLTPPFGFALFYFRSAAPRDISTADIYLGVAPFVGLQILAIGILIAWPELATWLPGLIF
ncbi:putative permease component of C4 dicarboxylatetransporter [Oceaniovalibus guishaninsula JLT2003]|uniref:Putative permease component of C4 dicarboxylatetransporter n=1 Tax=Oceaniovalibus guishaninsula JLT2003 TaxID=1231392 RepID=K2H6S3_9RHOB|nr:TRAP transporter large permease subunit [Oceaniovalibus guishaninsula]EKE43363.1 putative permease component of C4 dicarboxylatetransporter [Oceaniovalibus guishaninsula JLT2003]